MFSLPFGNEKHTLGPSKIICLGRNYAAHAKEMGAERPASPVLFLKPPSSLLPPDSEIIIPPFSKDVHHEVELAVIIGVSGKDILPEKAMEHVLGYTILLDMTARDLQSEAKKKGLPWTVSKGFDTFAPVGPIIVPAKRLDPSDLEIGLSVNGVTKQISRTSKMLFSIEETISYISSVMSLEKGDLIATGTPQGVGPVRSGDVIDAWIEEIGVLKERVISR